MNQTDNDRTVYVIDGYGMIYRSYYAFMRAPIRNAQGQNMSAVFGYFRVLASFIRQYKPTYLAVAMDSRTPTFRDELFAEYKATRQATPDELKEQFPIIESVMAALGLPMLRVDGFEADDILATIARRCSDEGRECFIISADKDLLQLVRPGIRVLRPSNEGGFAEMDRQGVFDYKGVWPEQILDYLTLIGDSSDNIPGVKGIGDKTATKLLEEFGDLDGIYANLDKIASASQREKLVNGKSDAEFSKKLVTLHEQVPLDRPVDAAVAPDTPGLVRLVAGDWSPCHVGTFNGPAAAALLRQHGVNQPANEIAKLGGGEAIIGAGPAGQMPDAGAVPSTTAKAFTVNTVTYAPAPAPSPEPIAGYDAKVQHYELVLDLERVRHWAELIRTKGICVIDTETDGLDPHTSRLVGISFSTGAGTGAYLPLFGPVDGAGKPWLANSGTPAGIAAILPGDEVRAILKPLLEDPAIRLVGQNIKFDYQMLKAWGVTMANPWFDTMIAAWLVDTTSNMYNMDDLARVWLNYRTIHFADLFTDPSVLAPLSAIAAQPVGGKAGATLDLGFDFDEVASPAVDEDSGEEPESAADEAKPGKAAKPSKAKMKAAEMLFSRVPITTGGIYSSEDCDVTWRLFEALEPRLEAVASTKLFREVEMPLVALLAEMEWQGMGLTPGALQSFSAELAGRLAIKEQEIHQLVGHPFNIASPKQLQEVLFVERKLQGTKKTKSGWSTDVSVLEELAAEDPVPQKILEHRSLAKLKSTYADALPQLINPRTQRIHTHLVQTGTATGRLSSKDPNLQNLPIRDEDGRRIREAFVPGPGCVFVSADYSQIELVVLAHYADDPGLISAFAQGIDVHRATGSLIFGVPAAEVSAEQRRVAKTINFGVMYGMSAFRLARELGVPNKQAQGFIDAYFANYSGIRRFIDDIVRQAETEGGVRTILGRFRVIPQITSRNRTEKQAAERVAVNTPIQGTAADIVKLAMLRVDRRLKADRLLSRIVLQVHDELILEVPLAEKDAVMALLAEEMPQAYSLKVPLRVSVEAGASWGVMH